MLGDVRLIPCARVVPPAVSDPVTRSLAAAIAIELSRRRPPGDREWAERMWATIAPRLADAIRVRAGPAGSIVAAVSVGRRESLAEVGGLALELRECAARLGPNGAELRGGIALGVIDGQTRSDMVERCAERLALAAGPGQWLVSGEVARRLENRFELSPAGVVPRWQMAIPEGRRALIRRSAAPVLPSAISGDAPAVVLGRAVQRRRLRAELAAAAAGKRRVVLVSAPAGGGKSYLLRRVLADAEVKVVAGVAFPPLGSSPLDPIRRLLAGLGADEAGVPAERLDEALARTAGRRARTQPAAIVIDDVHWASEQAIALLASAIAAGEIDAPLAWILSARTAALPALSALAALVDITVELSPLEPADRTQLLAHRLGQVPETVRAHVSHGAARGNPLYLEHLAEAIREGCPEGALPGTLHEAVLARLDGLLDRARVMTHWSRRRFDPGRGLRDLEREVGDWLDRLETSDVADLATIGRHLARLRAVDAELVIARSILQMPVSANRRLGWAIERLAAASTDALLDYLKDIADQGRTAQAAYEAQAAAERAERALRLKDAVRLLAFASQHDHEPRLLRRRGDLALALGRPRDALLAYREAESGDADLELQRRMARAEALLGQAKAAIKRLEALAGAPEPDPREACAAALDLARLRGLLPPEGLGPYRSGLARRVARTRAWARVGEPDTAHQAIRSLVLSGEPAACGAELVETAALARLAELDVAGLEGIATEAATALDNPHALRLLDSAEVAEARRTFLHWYA